MKDLKLKLETIFGKDLEIIIRKIEDDFDGGTELVINNSIFITGEEDEFEVFHEEDDLNNFNSLNKLIDYIREKLEEAIQPLLYFNRVKDIKQLNSVRIFKYKFKKINVMKAIKFLGKVIIAIVCLPFVVCYSIIILIVKLIIAGVLLVVMRKKVKELGFNSFNFNINWFNN